MRVRKIFAIGVAVLTVGLLGPSFNGAAQAATGGPIAGVDVNGNRTAGTVAIDGIFKSGTATFAGFTAGCIGGTVGGSVDRGPDTTPQFRLTSASIVCDSWLGDDAVITLVNNASCNILVNMADTHVHDTNVVDTGATKNADPSNVDGSASIPTGSGTPYPCVRVSILGSCTYYVDGSMHVNFDEAIKTVSGVTYQDLVLKGNSLRTQNPSLGCFGLVTNNGTITLNNIRFNVKVSTGTTGRGINFHS